MLLPEIMQNTSLAENEIANTKLFFVSPFLTTTLRCIQKINQEVLV